MSYKIFLDDIRDPEFVWPNEPASNWTVCRSVEEAIGIFWAQGWPRFVSFDHDLGEHTPSGMGFAHFLIEVDLEQDSMPANFRFHVHSANPVGASNISGLLVSYMTTKGIL